MNTATVWSASALERAGMTREQACTVVALSGQPATSTAMDVQQQPLPIPLSPTPPRQLTDTDLITPRCKATVVKLTSALNTIEGKVNLLEGQTANGVTEDSEILRLSNAFRAHGLPAEPINGGTVGLTQPAVTSSRSTQAVALSTSLVSLSRKLRTIKAHVLAGTVPQGRDSLHLSNEDASSREIARLVGLVNSHAQSHVRPVGT